MPEGPENAAMFASRLRWVTTTPLGVDVDPEVNCTNAMSVSDTVAGPGPGASSTSYDETIDRAGHTARSGSRCGSRLAVVTTARAAQDCSTAAVDVTYAASSLVVAGG